MARKSKHPIAKVHRRWGRRPTQRPHSTRKGRKGYDRRRERATQRELTES